MKRITIAEVLLVIALMGTASAGDPVSPLYEARLAATLAGWEASGAPPVSETEAPMWWPVSLNPASLCAGSLCAQSYCFGSLCGESMCLGSGCIGSSCIGSGCIASLCGVSGCAGTTMCLRKCGYDGGAMNVIDPTDNGTTFVNGSCYDW